MDKEGRKGRQRQLAALLKGIRVETGLSQADVAKAIGEPQSFVSKYEHAERRLDLFDLARIARALGVSLAEIVKRFEALG